jgi:leader peptidase (prepilin peptidase) / N-methyltransferase
MTADMAVLWATGLGVAALGGFAASRWAARLHVIHASVETATPFWPALAAALAVVPTALIAGLAGQQWLAPAICFSTAAAALALSDLSALRAPHWLSAVMASAGIFASFLVSGVALLEAVIACVLVYGCMQGLRAAFRLRSGRESMGGGDPGAAAAFATWLGASAPYVLAGAALMALAWAVLTRSSSDRLPFIPFLALSAVATAVCLAALTGQPFWPGPVFR